MYLKIIAKQSVDFNYQCIRKPGQSSRGLASLSREPSWEVPWDWESCLAIKSAAEEAWKKGFLVINTFTRL